MPLTTPYPGLQSILIIDNAHIHHTNEIEELVHVYGMVPSLISLELT